MTDAPKRVRRQDSLVDILEQGICLCNGATHPVLDSEARKGFLSRIFGLGSTQRADISIDVGGKVVSWRPRRVAPESVNPVQLLADMVNDAVSQVILLSNELNPTFYRDPDLIAEFRKAAEAGIKIWIMVRSPACSWKWLDSHPLWAALAPFEENGVYIRRVSDAGKADLVVVDGRLFRFEPDPREVHARAGMDAVVAGEITAFLVDLWRRNALNLMGDIDTELELDGGTVEGVPGTVYSLRNAKFPGVYIEYPAGGEGKAFARLERVAAAVMGANHSRTGMRYVLVSNGNRVYLRLDDKGQPAFVPLEGRVDRP